MPPSRSITLLSPDELRVELVALLSDASLHYATSRRLARERSSQEKSIESETASLYSGWRREALGNGTYFCSSPWDSLVFGLIFRF